MSNEFKRYCVMLDNFGWDINGNVIARHSVFGYREQTSNIKYPSAQLYETRQRRQVGYSSNYDGYANAALSKAGAPSNVKFTRMEGSRAEGVIYLIYDL